MKFPRVGRVHERVAIVSQEIVDWWNSWDDGSRLRNVLGMRLMEDDGEHVQFEIRSTDFNKVWGYFAGFALLGVVEHAPGILVHYEEHLKNLATRTVVLSWLTTDMHIQFVGNTKADVVVCESRWLERGEAECKVRTEIRDGEHVILRADSTLTKR